MVAYSKDLRERVAAAWDAGQTRARISERFGVSVSWVGGLMRRRRESGSIEAEPHSGGRGRLKLTLAGLGRLKAVAEARPDATLAELGEALESAGGPAVGRTTLGRALGPAGLGLTLKKSRCVRRSRTGRT